MSCSGFTLLEIILVVLIFSIVAGLALPNFSQSFKKHKLKTAMNDLVYLMRYAQNRAVTKSLHMRLEFNEEDNSYSIRQGPSSLSDRDYDNNFTRFKGRMGRNFEVPSKITIELEGSSVIFYPDGNIDKKNIRLCGEEECFLVTTKEQRGYVRVYKESI